ncbi:MAG TPA: LysR substrate-binding domain-containing protein [Ramlibacter sp.]|uniref:LysR family transcriptional regulator n=1 Tax=Ramlibacter sp. TaxID=1917967 RepID=UPI002D7F42F6|nr:LysR substrate-binding domain-containing protein [Ramlibacter sp.]HET8748035.1 LysR substrate-binding domain-containing protein [Ramlibacter sp.]
MRALPSVRQLRAFVAVYHAGQVSAAAEQLALTQPAVTVLLRELEDKLGVKLFDRSTRTLRRTEAANEAIAYAERALAELEGLVAGMAEVAGARRGRVRIAATSSVAQILLPPAMRDFRAVHPEVKVELEDVAPGEFVETLLAGRVDFGIGTLEASVPGLREQVFLHDALAAMGQPGRDFAAGRPLTWKQLAAFPVITVKAGYGVRRSIDAACESAGVALRVEHEVALLTTAVALAASGLGIAVVPASLLTRDVAATGLVARRLTRPVVERRVAVIRKAERSLSPAAQAFADLLLEGRET